MGDLGTDVPSLRTGGLLCRLKPKETRLLFIHHKGITREPQGIAGHRRGFCKICFPFPGSVQVEEVLPLPAGTMAAAEICKVVVEWYVPKRTRGTRCKSTKMVAPLPPGKWWGCRHPQHSAEVTPLAGLPVPQNGSWVS